MLRLTPYFAWSYCVLNVSVYYFFFRWTDSLYFFYSLLLSPNIAIILSSFVGMKYRSQIPKWEYALQILLFILAAIIYEFVI